MSRHPGIRRSNLDARSGEARLTLQGHTAGVNGCAVSLDGAFIVSASEDTTLKVRDARTGEARLILQGHTDRVKGCAVSPDGAFIVSVSWDTALKVWDARAGTCLITFPVEGALLACTFHPDGKHLVAAGASGVYLWNGCRRRRVEKSLVALSQEGVSLDGSALPGAECRLCKKKATEKKWQAMRVFLVLYDQEILSLINTST